MERAGLDAAPAARIADAASLVESNGFAIVPDLVDAGLIEDLIAACPPIPQAGVRDLFSAAPAFQTLTEIAPVRQIVESVLGKPGFVTRAILFDKAPGANWSLRFHQDVAVGSRAVPIYRGSARGPSRAASITSGRPRMCLPG